MRDKDLYASILGINAPWRVVDVELDRSGLEVRVRLAVDPGVRAHCPHCDEGCPRYDSRARSWRHLDTCQFKTILLAEVPRVQCPTHGVVQVHVPWAEPGSGFTALMEALVIDWLKEASIKAVAELVGLSWDQVDGIMQRAVQRGLSRRSSVAPKGICIDETSYQKRHQYVSVITDLDSGDVLFTADDRKAESIKGFFEGLDPSELFDLRTICMDMWPGYISVVKQFVPFAEERICFDKFHIAKHLGDAVDKVRRQEQRDLFARGDRSLVGTRFRWLKNPEHSQFDSRDFHERMKRVAMRTSRAWAVKEHAMCLWHYTSKQGATRAWKQLIGWAVRTRLDPIKRVGRMLSSHLYGVVNAVVLRATNARAESVNARIQRIKRMACGFRNRERFRAAIYFHLGGLELYPATHTTS